MINKKIASLIVGVFTLLVVCAGQGLAQKARKTVGAAETTGTFRDYFEGNAKGGFNEIKILAVGNGKLTVSFNLIYPDKTTGAGDVGNTGVAGGAATLAIDTATFVPADSGGCKITIRFVRPGQIKVTQRGNDIDCGFGANVSASGVYRKISGAKPRFNSADTTTAISAATSPTGRNEQSRGRTKIVRFAAGATSVVYQEQLPKGGIYKFIVGAKANQSMAIRVAADSGSVTFDVAHNGTTIPTTVDTEKWSDKLSAGGEYQINVKRKSGGGKFLIEISLE